MPERVTARRLVHTRIPHRLFHRALQQSFGRVMTFLHRWLRVIARVGRTLPGGEEILPGQVPDRSRIFPCQSSRQMHRAMSRSQILFMRNSSLLDLPPERVNQADR